MHAVVNHIPIATGADWDEMLRRIDEFASRTLPAHPEVTAMQVIRASDEEMILAIVFAGADAMAGFSSTVAAPWFAENIRPYMAGPADRKTGEVVFAYTA